MKKLIFLLSLFFLFDCASTRNTDLIEKDSSVEASYNVNIYDANDDWYETGLLIESFDNRSFVKIKDGRYELFTSNKEGYRYMTEIDGVILYVK